MSPCQRGIRTREPDGYHKDHARCGYRIGSATGGVLIRHLLPAAADHRQFQYDIGDRPLTYAHIASAEHDRATHHLESNINHPEAAAGDSGRHSV